VKAKTVTVTAEKFKRDPERYVRLAEVRPVRIVTGTSEIVLSVGHDDAPRGPR
jgi:hypothetical protein